MPLNGVNEILRDAQKKAGADKEVVFDPITKKYVFKKDLAKQRTQVTPTTTSNIQTRPVSKPAEEKPAAKKINYLCAKCKYKFSRNPEMVMTKCPYCGHPKVEVLNTKNVENVIKDSDGYDY